MRKKELLNQNVSLYNQLQKALIDNNELNKVISQKDNEIIHLKSEIERIKNRPNVTESFKRLEDKMIFSAGIDKDFEYGSEVIGKIVVSSTEYCNKIALLNHPDSKEMINLILGKTEVSKSDILNIVSSELDTDKKESAINIIEYNTIEYFKSVYAQID